MKTYTFAGGEIFTEKELIDYFYGKYWKLTYMREDLCLLFSALDKYKELTYGN